MKKYGKKDNGKNLTGRPSKITSVNLEMVKKLAAYGLIDREIADILGISEVTLNAWKKDESSEFLKSLKAGKEISDLKVLKSLYQRAIGYEFDEITIGGKDGGKTVKKHIPPDVTAQIFWLKNRRPAEWKESQHVELPVDNFNVFINLKS